MRASSKLMFAVVGLFAVAGAVASCGSSGSNGSGAGSCVANVQQACACLGGTTGIQVCNSDGKSFGMCQCSAGTGGASTTSSSTGSFTGAGGSGPSCQCKDPTPGEAELPYCGAVACADAGNDGGSTSSTSSGSSSSSAASSSSGCVGMTTYAGLAPTTFTATWTYQASTGVAAGDAACQAMGADHVCDYDDIVYALGQGELSTVPKTTTAWLQRTHPVTVTAAGPTIITSDGTCGMGGPTGQPLCTAAPAGTVFQSGPASRCNNWNYLTDHLNDGEWIDFSTGGSTPTLHLDNNPCAIQSPNPGKDAPCGHNGIPRSLLCCYAKNACNPTVAAADCTCSGGVCQ